MGKGDAVRLACAGLNLALLGGFALLLRAAFAPAALDLPRLDAVGYAIETAAAGPGQAQALQLIAQELDRPRPEPAVTAAPVEAPPPTGTLGSRYALVCVLLDPQDPFRCSAIVATRDGNAQTSLGNGDAFAGGTVTGIEVEPEPEGRRARVRVRLTGSVESLELFVPREPPP